MSYLRYQEQLRSLVDFALSYRWDMRVVQFPTGIASPPTSDLKTSNLQVTVSFIDDVNNTILNFFEKWINTEILNDGEYISTLETATKSLFIAKQTGDREIIDLVRYDVFPEGEINFVGNSESAGSVYSVNLIVTNRNVQKKPGDNFISRRDYVDSDQVVV